MKQTKSAIKARFTTGSKPAQDDYANWIDSFVHLDDQQAVDAQIISQLLVAYDQTLKTRNLNGQVDTLGDLLNMFAGVDDAVKLTDVFAKISWPYLPNKPAFISLTWNDQTVTTDSTTYNPLGSTGSAGAGPATRWLLAEVAQSPNGLIRDIRTERHWISTGSGGESGFYLDQIVGVKFAINPKVLLS